MEWKIIIVVVCSLFIFFRNLNLYKSGIEQVLELVLKEWEGSKFEQIWNRAGLRVGRWRNGRVANLNKFGIEQVLELVVEGMGG